MPCPVKPDDRQLMADMLLALNWARVVLKQRDRSEWEQRGYADLCSVVARAEAVVDDEKA